MNRKIIFSLLFLLTFASLPALGNREKTVPTIVEVTGIVRLVGTDLFRELVISNENNIWYIAADEINKLIEMQHRTVTVEGEETVTELQFANGHPAGTRRELRNIRIIYM